MPTPRALALAQSEGYDLIEIAPQATPPVCQIGDYGKFRYKAQQREKEAKKKQRTITWKEVRVAPKIDEHDLDTKIRTAIRLLGHGDKLKVVVRFRGRELAHPERGRSLLIEMAERLKDHGVVERPPLLEGRQMVMVMNAVRRDGAAPAPGTAPAPAKPAPPVASAQAPAAAAAAPRAASLPAARPAAPRAATPPAAAPRTAATRAPRAS